MPYPTFDRAQLKLLPLAERDHDMTLDDLLELSVTRDTTFKDPALEQVAERISAARRQGSPVILMMGAHVIKRGLSRFVVDMMERGILTHVAMNGACVIHDYELALIGATTESVARYIQEGQFGLWQETGQVNDMAAEAELGGIGLGEAAGRWIERAALAHREVSILGAGCRLGVPVTVHLGIGQDITHEHPNCDGAALGAASYTDFLVLANAVSQLQGGVMLNVGTAVMGPEVYLKALSMARNVAHQQGQRINRFTTAVFDLLDLGPDIHTEANKADARYYFRPYKTILVRTVQDGGESFYIQGDHRETIPALFRLVTELQE